MILDIYAPIARRWPRDGAALLTAPPIPRRCVEHPGILPRCYTHLFDIAGRGGSPEVAPGRPGPRANKARVWNENGESVRRMILDIYAPIARRWPRDGAALLTAPPIPRRCVEHPGCNPRGPGRTKSPSSLKGTNPHLTLSTSHRHATASSSSSSIHLFRGRGRKRGRLQRQNTAIGT